MTDRPILFSAPMIRALLAGTKTQTRRLLTAACDDPPAFIQDGTVIALDERDRPYRWPRTAAVGDRLWVREAWKAHSTFEGVKPRDIPPSKIFYLADPGYSPSGSRGRPSMFMPRWASRLTLVVTGVKVERLQDIINEDCIAEGVPVHPNLYVPRTGPAIDDFAREHGLISHYGAEYRRIWIEVNGPGSWEANPWVVALTFAVHKQNIDAMKDAA